MEHTTLTHKEKNMLKSARKRWVENKDIQTIADELGMSYSTIQNYFSDDEMQKFEQFFSDEEVWNMKVQLKQKIEQNTMLANDLIAEAVNDPEAGPRVKVKAGAEVQKILKRYNTMMQQLGLFDTTEQAENTEDQESLTERLQQAYDEMEEAGYMEEEVEAE